MDRLQLRRLFVLANAFKEGDVALGGTSDERLRQDARRELLGTTLGEIRRATLVEDGVSAALDRARDRRFDGTLDSLTIAGLEAILLGRDGPSWVGVHRQALSSETIAAVAKVMTNEELSAVCRGLFNPIGADEIAIGAPGHFGSRIQPNSPGDDDQEILFSILDALTYGCGDVVIGLNPAADDLDTIVRLEQLLAQVVRRLDLPTRYCVLSDIVKQHRAQAFTRVDVGFQSLAGTSRALVGMVGLDVDGILDLATGFDGLYFETGQGSAVTNGADEGVDMVTLESRAYGVARYVARAAATQRGATGAHTPWTIVNDVAGFIGPEVFATAEQLERACLEDSMMAKLHGLTMGLDVCATFHMGISPSALRRLTAQIVAHAAPAYLMAVAGNADPMLGYLTTSFREHPSLRRGVGRRAAAAMERRLAALGAIGRDGAPQPGIDTVTRLYAAYAGSDGDRRSAEAIEAEGRQRILDLRERGFDVGGLDSSTAEARVERIYSHARTALYATLDDSVIRDSTSRGIRIRTTAASRDDYLAHPEAGERLREDAARTVASLYSGTSPQVQFVISDGLNANAINEHLRSLLPGLRREVAETGLRIAEADIVIDNGRVRAGYEVGGLVRADVVVHLIGERPGTGLNTASAYLTYGRDAEGHPRWSRGLDHSATTAICSIHPRGKPPDAAVSEIVRTIGRVVRQRRSGVALRSSG
jgi:ethanolamine ammonia-lyase large subunit